MTPYKKFLDALEGGLLDVAKLLYYQNGYQVECRAIGAALLSHDKETLLWVVSEASPDEKKINYLTVFYEGIKIGSLQLVKETIEKCPVSTSEVVGNYAMKLAKDCGEYEILEYLRNNVFKG